MFQGRGMDDDIDPAHRLFQARFIAYIADEIAQEGIVVR